MVKNQYPLLLIPELIDQLWNATLFTKLDLRWGYNNIRIKDGDQWKGAFKTNLRLYEPCVMFFGLMNSPSTFQTMMDTIFRMLIETREVVVYMDNILIATTNNVLHHHQLVHQVLDKFKVQGVEEWERPKTLKELRGWMGFINFYQRFIKGFSQVACVLNELTKKDTPWEWTEEREKAFQTLKRLICEEPVLLMPKLEEPFEMEVDASNFAIGATLNQKDNLG